MEPVGSTLFFVGSASGQTIPGFDLWKSDGTPSGTIRLKDLSGAINLTPSAGRLFFGGRGSGSDEELWISDGTPEGTFRVKDINPGPNPSTPLEFADINGTIYFTAFSLGFGREIWKSDGTESGTQMLIDLVPGSGSGGAYGLTNVDGVLFFARFDSLQGWQLWKSDGTAPGTVLIKTIAPPDLPSKNAPSSFSSSHGKLYFSADDGVHEEELWVSDGESAGTYMVADLDVGPSGSSPVNFQTIGTLLYFAAGAHQGQELWCLDTRPTIPALPPYGALVFGFAVIVGGIFVLIRRNRMIPFNGKESHEIH